MSMTEPMWKQSDRRYSHSVAITLSFSPCVNKETWFQFDKRLGNVTCDHVPSCGVMPR